ncbi:hypothetical protein D3C87_504890 [compost metagenome]
MFSFSDASEFFSDALKGTAVVAGVIMVSPIFGAVGTITAAGLAVSAVAGTSEALSKQIKKNEE